MKCTLALAWIAMVILFACKKEDQQLQTEDCETNDYGVLKVTFSSTDANHAVYVQRSDASTPIRQKVFNPTFNTDTLHMNPGQYDVLLWKRSFFDPRVFMKKETVVIKRCEEVEVECEL